MTVCCAVRVVRGQRQMGIEEWRGVVNLLYRARTGVESDGLICRVLLLVPGEDDNLFAVWCIILGVLFHYALDM